jgi:hypothetical protein
LIFLWSLFGGETSIPINRLVDEMSWPTTHNGKVVRWTIPFKMSNLHYNQWEVGWVFEATINPPLKVLLHGYGRIYKIIFGQNPPQKKYEITIGNFPTCICLDFVIMISSLLGWARGKWAPCKHMYCVLYYVMFCGEFEIFIHFPTWSCDEAHCLLTCNVTSMWIGMHFWIVIKNNYNEHCQF